MKTEIYPKAPLIKVITTYQNGDDGFSQDSLIDKAIVKGPGIFGDQDIIKNRESSGILNHQLIAGRLAGSIARQYNSFPNVIKVNAKLIEWGHFFDSHAGRIIWDSVEPETKQELISRFGTNEKLGIEILERGKINESILLLVKALGHGLELPTPEILEFKKTLEFKIASYADHRTDQSILPLDVRMADFLVRNFLVDQKPINKENSLIYVQTAINIAKKDSNFSGEIAADLFGQSGLYLQEARGNTLSSLFQLIIEDARTEMTLEALGLEPSKWVDEESRIIIRRLRDEDPKKHPSEDDYLFIKPNRLERYIRCLHIQSIENVLFDRTFQAKTGDVTLLLNEDKSIYAELGTNPYRTWWDNEVKKRRKVDNDQIKVNSNETLQTLLPNQAVGANRAISFFEYLDLKSEDKNAS